MVVALESPSSRRAWIEIPVLTGKIVRSRSPSSRRAWIEISQFAVACSMFMVALLAEGVDRNN